MIRRALAPTLNCIVALAAFAAACLVAGKFTAPFVEEVTPKLDFFQQHKDEYDTLFVGSSRIFHGISPKVFDETLRAAGCESRSFNAAADGMGTPESVMWIHRLVALRPRKLKRVFLEVTDPLPLPRKQGEPALRDIYWQRPDALRFAMGKFRLDAERRPLAEACGGFLVSLRLFARNESSAGRGLERLEALLAGPGPKQDYVLGPDQDGFFPMNTPMSPDALAKYHGGLDRTKAGLSPQPVNPVNREEYAGLRRELAASGIGLFFLAAPTTALNSYWASVDAPPGAPLFAFNDPAAFATLYEDGHRLDYEHLNGAGAAIFSRMLAERFARHLAGEP